MRGIDPDLDQLIANTRAGDAPTPADRERIAGALAKRIGGAALILTAAATVATTSAGEAAAAGQVGGAAALGASKVVGGATLSLLAKLGAAVVVAGLSVGGVVMFRQPATPSAPAQLAEPPPLPTPPAKDETTGAPTEVASAAPIVAAAEESRPPAHASPTNQGETAPRTKSLEQEVALLQEAQRALRDNQAGRALMLLDEHARQFPNGGLQQEMLAARVMALCALSRTAEARRQAEAFLKQNPRSPLAAQVRGSCGNPTARKAQ